MPAPVVSMGFFAHTSDATFQAWGTELHNLIVNAGLTQTADTGQVNTATMTRPGTSNLSAGGEIFRFNDSLQATAPIFFKIEYGTGSATAVPVAWITVGTGSNGSGTITGILLARTQLCTGNSAMFPLGATQQFISQSCYNTTYGMCFVNFKVGGITGGVGMLTFVICRSVDSAGVPTSTGMNILLGSALNQSGGSNTFFGCYNFVTGFTATSGYSSTGIHGCAIPYGITTTIINGQVQVFRYYQCLVDVLPMVAVLAVTPELPKGATFQASPNGTPITYLVLPTNGTVWTLENTNVYGLAVIFQ